MINPNSTLYHKHPDWALHDGKYPRTLTRNLLVLNIALPEVPDHLVNILSNLVNSANISYVKWDSNRPNHQMPSPVVDHRYMLDMDRLMDNLTSNYPHILWKGCASGGGCLDTGIFRYMPQSWTSDNTGVRGTRVSSRECRRFWSGYGVSCAGDVVFVAEVDLAVGEVD